MSSVVGNLMDSVSVRLLGIDCMVRIGWLDRVVCVVVGLVSRLVRMLERVRLLG